MATRGWRLVWLVFGALAASGCCRPDTCPQAFACHDAQLRLADALEAYRAEHRAYPGALTQLGPDAGTPPGGTELGYRSEDGGYQLRCTYSPPGMNVCTLDQSRAWSCYGYY